MLDYDVRQNVFGRAGYMCEYCGARATEIAHRIAKTQYNIKHIQRYIKNKYGVELSLTYIRNRIINHPKNLASSCREHNDYFNIGNRIEEAHALVDEIYKELRSEARKVYCRK